MAAPMALHPATLTFTLIGIVVLAFLALGVLIWLWGTFLDNHEHNPARVRITMLGILAASTILEVQFNVYGLTCSWVVAISIVVNLWGGLDALLRFPASHDLESFFTTKQFSLLVLKTFSYAFGINGFKQHVGAFLLILVILIWGLPVLYLMALPLDPAEQICADERDDVDLVMRVWNLTTCQSERQRCLRGCKKWLNRRLLGASQHSPLAKLALCAASPSYRRVVSKGCRSV